LNAVIGTPSGSLTRNHAREGRLEARAWVASSACFGAAPALLRCALVTPPPARKVPMSDNVTTTPRTKVVTKTKRPPLHKVILLNDDYTPREFVIVVLKAVFRMNEDVAYNVMMTAHRKGVCVIAVYAKDIAETKAKEATELGKQKGYPLAFTTEPEQ
jgi:ATP-dependent Clp protease adaptor protein ClpS